MSVFRNNRYSTVPLGKCEKRIIVQLILEKSATVFHGLYNRFSCLTLRLQAVNKPLI